MNLYDTFSIYNLSGHIQGNFPEEFRGFLKNFIRSYIRTIGERDKVIYECLKMKPDPPNIKISSADVSAVSGKMDGRIVQNPVWGILY